FLAKNGLSKGYLNKRADDIEGLVKYLEPTLPDDAAIGWPRTYVIDRNGKVVKTLTSMQEYSAFQSAVAPYLAKKERRPQRMAVDEAPAVPGPSVLSDDVLWGAGDKGGDVLFQDEHQAATGRGCRPAEVRGDDAVRRVEQRVVRRGWFDGEHIEAGA